MMVWRTKFPSFFKVILADNTKVRLPMAICCPCFSKNPSDNNVLTILCMVGFGRPILSDKSAIVTGPSLRDNASNTKSILIFGEAFASSLLLLISIIPPYEMPYIPALRGKRTLPIGKKTIHIFCMIIIFCLRKSLN